MTKSKDKIAPDPTNATVKSTVGEVLEETLGVIRGALQVPSNSEIQFLEKTEKGFEGQVSSDKGLSWYTFVVGPDDAEIIAKV